MRIWMRFLRNMQFVCKQVPSIIDYMQTSGVVVGKTGPHNVKKRCRLVYKIAPRPNPSPRGEGEWYVSLHHCKQLVCVAKSVHLGF